MENFLKRLSFLNKRLDRHMGEIASSAGAALAIRISAVGLTFIFNVLLSRFLGADGAGVYYLAFMALNFASVFGTFGFNNVLVRYIAGGVAVDDWGSVKGAYKKTMVMASIASIISACALFFTAPLISSYVFEKPAIEGVIRWMSLAIIPLTLVILHTEALKGLKRISESLLTRFTGLNLISIIFLYFLSSWGIKGAVWAYTIAAAVMALAGVWLWRRAVGERLKDVHPNIETGKLLKAAMPLFLVDIMLFVYSWTSTFMLGIWAAEEDVGIFSMAQKTSLLIGLVLFASNTVVAPKFAELYRRGDKKALAATARGSAVMTTILAAPLLLVFIAAPGWIMGFFGQKFTSGGTALSILAIGQFVNVAAGSVGYLLIMSGKENVHRNNMAFNLAVSIILNFILIPKYGIIGASIATSASVILINITASVLVYKHLSIKIWERGK